MPSGRTHRHITTALALLSLPVAALNLRMLAYSAGIVSGIFVDPDMDVDRWNESERILYRLWPPLGWAWRFYWGPYALLAKHRGLSHALIAGTLVRAVYVFVPALVVFGAADIWPPAWALLLWLAGLCTADLGHIVADRFWSKLKRKVRRWFRW